MDDLACDSNNAARKVRRAFRLAEFRRNIFWTEVPCYNVRTGQRELRLHPFILPHVSASLSVSDCALTADQILHLRQIPAYREALEDLPSDKPLLLAHGFCERNQKLKIH